MNILFLASVHLFFFNYVQKKLKCNHFTRSSLFQFLFMELYHYRNDESAERRKRTTCIKIFFVCLQIILILLNCQGEPVQCLFGGGICTLKGP